MTPNKSENTKQLFGGSLEVIGGKHAIITKKEKAYAEQLTLVETNEKLEVRTTEKANLNDTTQSQQRKRKHRPIAVTKGICEESHSLIGLFTEYKFCYQPPGDTATRKSVFGSSISGCILVILDPFTAYYQYPWHLPPDHTKYSVFIDQEDVKDMKVNVMEILMKVTMKKRDEMRRYIVYELMPKLVYGDQKEKFDLFQDAFSITINDLIERVKTLNLN
ncbi:Exostosin-like protein [Artemisia annua]|uniref:Exostosin-like protein n=1 Tax=Artemisia annua TaxID=35608 RepID=A0A2U1NP80_ARTAN|nr:Exostosin-like protein [Artemisia annua]